MVRLLFVGCCYLLLSTPVFAWGPGMHYYLAQQLVELGMLGGAYGGLILEQKSQFLFGNIIADVIVGKNLLDVENHSHHWNVAESLREGSRSHLEKAFSLGYWTHLAADTVAHNVFLTRESISPPLQKFSKIEHAYLELQAESWVDKEYHLGVGELLEMDFRTERELLEEVVPKTVLPFGMNWFLMDNWLKYTADGTAKSLAGTLNRIETRSLADSTMDYYVEICLDRMNESLLENNSRITRLNPISQGTKFLD